MISFSSRDALINKISRIAYAAMDTAYIRHRSQASRIDPDWDRTVREKYLGTVYEYPSNPTIVYKQMHIDPHRYHTLKQIVYAWIDGSMHGEKGYEYPEQLLREIRTLESKIENNDAKDLEQKVMIAGLISAMQAIGTPKAIARE